MLMLAIVRQPMASQPSNSLEEYLDSKRALTILQRELDAPHQHQAEGSTNECIHRIAIALRNSEVLQISFEKHSHDTIASRIFTEGLIAGELNLLDAMDKLVQLRRREIGKSAREIKHEAIEGCQENEETSEGSRTRDDQEYDLVSEDV
jgi:hypothetical protein